jgi:hypothetical protein
MGMPEYQPGLLTGFPFHLVTFIPIAPLRDFGISGFLLSRFEWGGHRQGIRPTARLWSNRATGTGESKPLINPMPNF